MASTSRIRRARTSHPCDAREAPACTRWIEAGQVYQRTVVFPGEIYDLISVFRTCSTCMDWRHGDDPATAEARARRDERDAVDAMEASPAYHPPMPDPQPVTKDWR